VALHGAIGAQAVRLVRRQKEAFAKIWRADIETCAVTTVDIPLFPARRAAIAGWNIVIDAWILQRLAELRSGGLPNETGGVLLGTYDLPRKTVYVVDTIPSPPDSEEWPTLYIRGCQGLLEKITETTAQTAGQLEYVGEWHSHPDGFSCCPSADDFKVFSWMTDHMSVVGLPALMAIAGEGSASLWFLGQMAADGGWATAAAQSP
jgi:proteasome lid subunit RPN8/RPN11